MRYYLLINYTMDEIRNKLLSDCKIISETYNKFNPIISVSAALYLPGIKNRIPEDIDVIFGIPKHKFLKNLGDIKFLTLILN